MQYYTKSAKEVLQELQTTEDGLRSTEAHNRLDTYGPNTIHEKEGIHPFKIFLAQFKSPIVWILLAAMVITVIVQEYTDLVVIGIIVVLNAILGFIQEYRAERAIEALKKMISLKATVLRDGKAIEIDAQEIVPGDILLLETGDKIPADARLISQVNMQTQEAALTGESTPVSKYIEKLHADTSIGDQKNMVFSGTVITNGHGKAVVTTTSMKTEIGKIAKLIQETVTEPTPLQKKLKSIGMMIGIIVLVIAAIVFLVGFLGQGQPLIAILLTAIALAVAAIPEGLPAVITLSLSVGVQRLTKKNALVRKLPSVETLGACTVICSDKTGTLTHNEMTVRRIYANHSFVTVSGSGYGPEGTFSMKPAVFERLLIAGALNNNAQLRKENSSYEVMGDPTEAALLVSAQKAGINSIQLQGKYPRVSEIEFSSERKRMTTIHQDGTGQVAYMKGAVDVLLGLCDRIQVGNRVVRLTKKDRDAILQANEVMASDALRVLGFAYKDIKKTDKKEDTEKNMIFLGLQGMIDPARKEVKQAIKKCDTAGISVIMITGDHMTTAKAVGKELGILGKALTGLELDKISQKEFEKEIENVRIFARVNPSHKLRIVEALKKHGHIVAMTGDGVNDAPALKKADLGISMGITGTDVAKEASDMILADDNFSTIVRAVEEGRRIFDNIQKFLAYLLSGNIAEVLVVFIAMLLGFPLPLTAIQILWVNLMTDGLPALALGADPVEPGAMKRKPRKPTKSIFKGLEGFLIAYPIWVTLAVLIVFAKVFPGDLVKAQTMAFTLIVFFELFETFSCRSITKPSFNVGIFKNKWLMLAIVGSIALHAIIMYTPFLQGVFGVTGLSGMEWLTIIAITSTGFILLEVQKMLRGKTPWF